MDLGRIAALIFLCYHDAPFTARECADFINAGSPAAVALRLALAETAHTPLATPATSIAVALRLRAIAGLPVHLGERHVVLRTGMSLPGMKGSLQTYQLRTVAPIKAEASVSRRN